MNRKFDNMGRIVIPIEMRKKLGLGNGDEIKIELGSNEIIITNPNQFDVKKYIQDIKLNKDISLETNNVLDSILEKL